MLPETSLPGLYPQEILVDGGWHLNPVESSDGGQIGYAFLPETTKPTDQYIVVLFFMRFGRASEFEMMLPTNINDRGFFELVNDYHSQTRGISAVTVRERKKATAIATTGRYNRLLFRAHPRGIFMDNLQQINGANSPVPNEVKLADIPAKGKPLESVSFRKQVNQLFPLNYWRSKFVIATGYSTLTWYPPEYLWARWMVTDQAKIQIEYPPDHAEAAIQLLHKAGDYSPPLPKQHIEGIIRKEAARAVK